MLIAPRQLSAGGRQTNPTSLAKAFGKTNVLCGSGTVDTHVCYTQRRRDNFPGTQFFLDKFLFSKKGLGQGIPKQLVELKKVSEFFDGSLSPSENRPLGEKTLSSQMLLELNFF